jgi:hypothetical protein
MLFNPVIASRHQGQFLLTRLLSLSASIFRFFSC